MIEFEYEHPLEQSMEGILETAARSAVVLHGQPAEFGLTITLTGDARLHELNAKYLGIDAPTDVLSFSSGEIDPETHWPYLGDVIISVPRAQEQASAAGHSLQAELELLTVHGVLHLLGYDHFDETSKAAMWSLQEKILSSLGSQLSRLPE